MGGVLAQSVGSRPAALRLAHSPTGSQLTRPEPGAQRKRARVSGDGFPDSEGFELERAVLESGRGRCCWAREGRPGSPADDTGSPCSCLTGQWRPSCSSWPTWTCWASADTCPGDAPVGEVSLAGPRGAIPALEARPPQRCGERHRLRPALCAVGGPRAGRAWGNPKREALRVG